MKIEVINPNKIVDSAFITETDLAFSVFINTAERYVYPNCMGFGSKELTFEFFPETEESFPFDIVKVTAENEEEEAKFHRLHFLLDEKDQLWYLFPVEHVYHQEEK